MIGLMVTNMKSMVQIKAYTIYPGIVENELKTLS